MDVSYQCGDGTTRRHRQLSTIVLPGEHVSHLHHLPRGSHELRVEGTKAGAPHRRSTASKPEGVDPAVAVRLPPGVLAQVDQLAAAGGMKRSDVIRELVGEAIAGRMIEYGKAARKKK